MNLELLANELLLELFKYFSVIDLLRAFRGLNARFDSLLFVEFRSYCLDFRSISKRDFDIICQQYLPLIIDRIISLHLSNDDETPQQIKCFLSHSWTLRQLTHLRSLSLCHLRSAVVMSKLMTACHDLHHLTHLNLIECRFRDNHIIVCRLLNDIWKLPKLTHCYLDVYSNGSIIIVPSMISRSLKYLTIEPYNYGLNDLARLFQNTPCLQYLCVNLKDDSDDQPLCFTVSSMITLTLHAFESSAALKNLLKNMPNLRNLTVVGGETNMDGHFWEQIIVDHLFKLKVFRLKMSFRLRDDDNKEQQVDELLDSFRTRFWLDERQWFVRCDWDRYRTEICLYTLPYAFGYYHFHNSNVKSKSTCRYDDDSLSYNNILALRYSYAPSSNSILTFFRFSNIHHLDLHLPVDDNFLSIIPKLDQLISLKVEVHGDDNGFDAQSQLQVLLDRAPCLYSLRFAYWPSSSTQMPPFLYSSKSIRRLDLRDITRFYDAQQCVTLSHSPLGSQCEVLFILVENRRIIIDLIKMMNNLRALNVVCRDDAWESGDDELFSSTEDELVEWLKHRLPSTCTITRNDDEFYDAQCNSLCSYYSIRLWIG